MAKVYKDMSRMGGGDGGGDGVEVFFRKRSFPPNLYEECDESDNETDPEFLSVMRRNPYRSNFTFEQTVHTSIRIVLQFCACVIFGVIYYHMRSGVIPAYLVLISAMFSSLIGYIIINILPAMRDPILRNWDGVYSCIPREHIQVTVLYFILAQQLSPVLRTLTFTVSTDSIHATTIAMVVIHLFTSDYGIAGFLRSSTVSANAAVIGSICLASRMSTDFHCMALLTLAVQVFILFPRFSFCMWKSTTSIILSVLIAALCSTTISNTFFLTFVTLIFLLAVILPILFIICVHHKNNIYGPWDEAQIVSLPQQPIPARKSASSPF